MSAKPCKLPEQWCGNQLCIMIGCRNEIEAQCREALDARRDSTHGKWVVSYARKHLDHMPITLEYDDEAEADRMYEQIQSFTDLAFSRKRWRWNNPT